MQDIEAHLLGGIPNADIEAFKEYWEVYPSLKQELFMPNARPQYSDLRIAKENIKACIFNHAEFVGFSEEMDTLFSDWKNRNTQILKALTVGIKPKQIIHNLSEDVLTAYTDKKLMDKYDVYQHLMNYWNETLQDDCYLIAVDGWKAEITYSKKSKSGTFWDCDLVPKFLVIDRYFAAEKKAIEALEAKKEMIATQIAEMEEDHGSEDGYFADLEKVNKVNVQKRLKAIDSPIFKTDNAEEIKVLKAYLQAIDKQAELSKTIKDAINTLDLKVLERYKTLTEAEIKQLVVDDKWMTSIEKSVKSEMERISQRLTQRIKELAQRYERSLPQQSAEVSEWESKVKKHLETMGFTF